MIIFYTERNCERSVVNDTATSKKNKKKPCDPKFDTLYNCNTSRKCVNRKLSYEGSSCLKYISIYMRALKKLMLWHMTS